MPALVSTAACALQVRESFHRIWIAILARISGRRGDDQQKQL